MGGSVDGWESKRVDTWWIGRWMSWCIDVWMGEWVGGWLVEWTFVIQEEFRVSRWMSLQQGSLRGLNKLAKDQAKIIRSFMLSQFRKYLFLQTLCTQRSSWQGAGAIPHSPQKVPDFFVYSRLLGFLLSTATQECAHKSETAFRLLGPQCISKQHIFTVIDSSK